MVRRCVFVSWSLRVSLVSLYDHGVGMSWLLRSYYCDSFSQLNRGNGTTMTSTKIGTPQKPSILKVELTSTMINNTSIEWSTLLYRFPKLESQMFGGLWLEFVFLKYSQANITNTKNQNTRLCTEIPLPKSRWAWGRKTRGLLWLVKQFKIRKVVYKALFSKNFNKK